MQTIIRLGQKNKREHLDSDSALVRYNTRMTISRNVTKSVTQMTTKMSQSIVDDVMRMVLDNAKRR